MQEGLAHYEIRRGPRAVSRAEANIADAVQKLSTAAQTTCRRTPAWQQALQADSPAALRRALDAGGGCAKRRGKKRRRRHPRRLARRPHPAAQRRGPAQIRRSLSLYDVVYVNVIEEQERTERAGDPDGRAEGESQRRSGRRRVGAVARAADGAGRGAGSRKQDRAHPRHGRRVFLSAEPAQPRLADAASARLGDQAADLSDGAAIGLAAKHFGARRADHVAADRQRRQRQPRASSAPTSVWRASRIIGRRAMPTITPAASSRCGAGWKIRSTSSPRGFWTAASMPSLRKASTAFAPPPSRRKSTKIASAIYPFVLGAQPVRMIDLAAFYAAVANEGALPQPHSASSRSRPTATPSINIPTRRCLADRRRRPCVVLSAQNHLAGCGGARHGARDRRACRLMSPARPAPPRIRSTAGSSALPMTSPWRSGSVTTTATASAVRSAPSATGARVALPIFRADHPRNLERGHRAESAAQRPSQEAQRHLVDLPIDYMSGDRVSGGGFMEHFRRAADGQLADTQYQLISQEDA